MATIRLSVTIPSTLHERLEGLRDRVNVSKVCTVALEKELDMLEARPSIADPEIAQLVERLKGARQRWYDRGHEDGKRWAVMDAKRDDLEWASDNMATLNSMGLQKKRGDLPGYPTVDGRIEAWVAQDLGLEKVPPRYEENGSTMNGDHLHLDQERRDNTDEPAYLEGWRDALVELWKAVAPALR